MTNRFKLILQTGCASPLMHQRDPETQTAGTVFGFVLERWILWLEECITKNWCSRNTALICCRSLILLVKFWSKSREQFVHILWQKMHLDSEIAEQLSCLIKSTFVWELEASLICIVCGVISLHQSSLGYHRHMEANMLFIKTNLSISVKNWTFLVPIPPSNSGSERFHSWYF